MKVIFLNIFEGCPEKDRYERIVDYVKKESPDTLGLSELNGWEEDDSARLKDFQKRTGLVSCAFGRTESGYHIGLFSKLPVKHSVVVTQGLRKAKATIDLIHGGVLVSVILTHLSARDEDTRLKELDIILGDIKKEEPTILMGDMNSLSPLDTYDEDLILRKQQEIGKEKFGKDKIRREVIQKIMDHGFVDAVKYFSQDFEYSVPTPFSRDIAHFTKLRLDYIFVTKNLLTHLESAKIIRNPETDQLSDHYPLVAELDL